MVALWFLRPGLGDAFDDESGDDFDFEGDVTDPNDNSQSGYDANGYDPNSYDPENPQTLYTDGEGNQLDSNGTITDANGNPVSYLDAAGRYVQTGAQAALTAAQKTLQTFFSNLINPSGASSASGGSSGSSGASGAVFGPTGPGPSQGPTGPLQVVRITNAGSSSGTAPGGTTGSGAADTGPSGTKILVIAACMIAGGYAAVRGVEYLEARRGRRA